MHTQHQTRRRNCRSAAGFSLIELLMCIMIIGVMSSLAMMFLGSGISDDAAIERDRRNAQTIATMASMAGAAGAEYFVEGDEEATLQNLRNGCSPGSGIFKDRVFKLPDMTDDQIQRTRRYLKLNNTDLAYDSSGTN